MEDWKELTIARWKTVSPELRISIGDYTLAPKQVIKEIEQNSSIGLKIVDMEKQYLRSLKYVVRSSIW